ncbi:hypothetical protein IAQ61_003928 [Plenodomus lingam]|uniref:Similar to subtilisin-like serine protease PR1A n=1 Tax=Leptosphaeria maculans (strain JN3 / isolate v23.1.3 / race Av1-4-5-6-7-8) TaxID=985895 RepID=E4ZQP9_LEPMJ|nr:similar to subtilisin-like serine protease PR1A [Plenodomus lingam JN3]KAH9874738.1 hypothetical protein IAQ61_003928 [Plenodomus lingam]CBX94054.1 similar to subtilisin-like serine protease PR1A [Plenodomus lingam JN3]
MKFLALFALLPLVIATPQPEPIVAPRDVVLIPNQYIVQFKPSAMIASSVAQLIRDVRRFFRADVLHIYEFAAFGGFAGTFSEAVADGLRRLHYIADVEQDLVLSLDFGKVPGIVKRAFVTQSSTSSIWGLGRLSFKTPNAGRYVYDSTAGAATCVYVIDTGVETTHPEFEGRATFLANFAGDGTNVDGNGHGTHVAGTVGSKTYGVAKRAKIYAVKVLKADGSGALSGVIAGINFAANDGPKRNCRGTVANLSVGGGKSEALNSAAANAVSSGMFLAVAAGNSAQDANNASPASEVSAFTVGATDSSDRWASFSNFGSVVNILAPGVGILSTWKGGATAVLSGTSMATPHVAGLAAYFLALEGKKSPPALAQRILGLGNRDRITGVPAGTINMIPFNGNPSG